MKLSKEEIQKQVERYHWYHSIEIGDSGITTPGNPVWMSGCRWANGILGEFDCRGKKILDVGARDCYFSFESEKRGAADIEAIDHDISLGARDFLIPLLDSRIKLSAKNLYNLEARHAYDLIIFCGVLYHLRYPFRALRALVDALKIGGLLFIEGGFLSNPDLEQLELLYCPVERSPYEPSSCTFFNALGLDVTMNAMGCKKERGMLWWANVHPIDRAVVVYQKIREQHYPYWEPGRFHSCHSDNQIAMAYTPELGYS